MANGNNADSVLDQDLISRLIGRARGEEPVISLYLQAWGNQSERRAVLKNLVREGEAAIEDDPGWDAERRKHAKTLLERARTQAEELLSTAPTQQGRGAVAIFAMPEGLEFLRVPVDLRDRIVVDRSPYASPLSSLIDQYERYGVIICDQKKARLFDVYLGQLQDWEELEHEKERHRHFPAGGPARHGGSAPAGKTNAPGGPAAKNPAGAKPGFGAGGYQGLEELRRRNHAEYVLHLHLQSVADRAFRRFRLRPYDRLILTGTKEVLPALEEHLHSYLKQRVVAKEVLPIDITQKDARDKVLAIEAKVEEQKEHELLTQIQNSMGNSQLGVAGVDQTLRALFFGQVRTLVVLDDDERPGRECPECHFLFPHPESAKETSPTLIECPVCKRPTRRVPDIVDEAVELAILSGSQVEHVAYAKSELQKLGGMAALLRFK